MTKVRGFTCLTLVGFLGLPSTAMAQVVSGGYVPQHNQIDPDVIYAAYSFGETDAVGLRVDHWGGKWGGGGAAAWSIAPEGEDGPQLAGMLLRQLHEHSNCMGLDCLGIQVQLGGVFTHRAGESIWEVPVTAGVTQRFSIPAGGALPGLVGHLWGSVSIIGQWLPDDERLGWAAGGGGRVTFHGALAPWGLQIFYGGRWFDGDGDWVLEVGAHRVLKAL